MIAVTLKNRFAQAADIFDVLPFQRVAARAKANGQDLFSPTGTMHRALKHLGHSPALHHQNLFAFNDQHVNQPAVNLETAPSSHRTVKVSSRSQCPVSASGKLIFHVFAVLAQFERDVNSERTKAGLAAARARGRMGGPKMKTTAQQDKLMRDLWDAGNATAAEIAKQFNISIPTFFRRVKAKSLKRS